MAAAGAVMGAALLQVTLAPPFNLVVVAVVVVAAILGARTGMVLACVGGLLLDLASPGPLGPHALALLPGAYVAGVWSRWVSPLPASLIYSGVLLAVHAPPIEEAARVAAVGAVYNSLLALAAFLLVGMLSLGRITRRAQA